MKLKALVALGCSVLLFMTNASSACSPRSIRPDRENNRPAFMLHSSNGQVMMKVIPGHFIRNQQGTLVETLKSRGETFRIARNGRLDLLWSLPGVYPHSAFSNGDYYLADDGMHLVHINDARSMDDKNAMVIYRQGKPMRRYAPKDFMPTFKMFTPTSCGTNLWLDLKTSVSLNGRDISFQTIDGKKWYFDLLKQPRHAN